MNDLLAVIEQLERAASAYESIVHAVCTATDSDWYLVELRRQELLSAAASARATWQRAAVGRSTAATSTDLEAK